jgi:DNA repair protein RadC
MHAYILKNADSIVTNGTGLDSHKIYVLKIKDMPTEDKPRERLLKYGAEALSVPELIAVVLNTGTKKEDVLSMASRVVKEYGEQLLIGQTNIEQIAADLDIPLVKALQIVACGELGRRFFQKQTTGPLVLRTAKDVYAYARDMQYLPKEYLRGIYLNTHYRVIHDEIVSIGTINANLIHPREVFKPAIGYGAAGVILVHNHPSGVIKPSEADIEITKQLVQVGKMVGINLIDHVIIGKNKFLSIDIDYA